MREIKRGFHISFEGIDGSGKTTLSTNLYLRFKEKGYPCFYTVEPTFMRVGSLIRIHASRIKNVPQYYMALLFAADRVEHYERVIKKKLEKGYHVISDRYVHSSIAYQGGLLNDIEWVRRINNKVPLPDLAIYLDISPDKALNRKKKISGPFDNIVLLNKIRETYLSLVNMKELVMVDAEKPLEVVLEDVVEIIKNRLNIDL
ncbi:MAG: dTMP kinase [Crenarchaeota archaeon]|nr:dTMP kinase [Thermoproteota archaeon]MDW8033971.1 dTMP kinase [Nitrososphaerota archaeon]